VICQGATDLYLFQIKKSADNRYHLYSPKFLSGFNPGGYTNQPWFTPGGEILVSVRVSGETQNDIYQLSLKTNKYRRLTRTSANEYSPRIKPDGKHLTVVRQVEGDILDQQLIQISPLERSFIRLIPDTRDVGYYSWLNDYELALFQIEGGVHRLVYHHIPDAKSRRITSAIGRTLLSDGKGSVIYVHKFADDYWYLKMYNPVTATIDILTEILPGAEDFTRTPDGTFFMGREKKLFFFHPDVHTSWQEMADLSMYGVHHITRLAVSPDGRFLALVAEKKNL
jgi:hypothetical protein